MLYRVLKLWVFELCYGRSKYHWQNIQLPSGSDEFGVQHMELWIKTSIQRFMSSMHRYIIIKQVVLSMLRVTKALEINFKVVHYEGV